MPNSTSIEPKPVGWVHSPNGRGTIDILWSCGVTIILCTWSVVCVNVSAPTSGAWRLFIRKIWLALMCSLGPEFLLALAVGQWQSARRSVKDFHGEGFIDWKMKHAFYADMGGFYLKLSDVEPFPLDSAKIIWLFRQGYLSRERLGSEIVLPKREIEDKNKADNTVRLITSLQTIWFVINIIGRAIQHLAITTMELTVCGFIVTTIPVIFFWSHKPADINTSQVINLDISTDEIHQRAGGKALQQWYRTPLDFLEEPQTWIAPRLVLLRPHPPPHAPHALALLAHRHENPRRQLPTPHRLANHVQHAPPDLHVSRHQPQRLELLVPDQSRARALALLRHRHLRHHLDRPRALRMDLSRVAAARERHDARQIPAGCHEG